MDRDELAGIGSFGAPGSRADIAVDALAELAVGVVTVDRDGEIVLANPCATAFFSPVPAVGLRLRGLFAVSGVSHDGTLVAGAEAGGADLATRLRLLDGRILDARSRATGSGGSVITLLDVTRYVLETERAARDPLTGLVSRIEMRERVGDLLSIRRRDGGSAALLALDLDRFKLVNDTLGHPVGDALLIKVAERLNTVVRQGDLVARFGGDEFAILLANACEPAAIEAMARRLVDLLGRSYVVMGHMVNIGVSVGIALLPDDGADAETLLRHADLALYRAKSDGRGVFRFFKAGMNEAMEARRLLEIDLRRAVALKQFELAYQPQFDLERNLLVGFEALLRWNHPTRGMVPPSEFVPLAEEIGLMAPIGEWAMRAACREAASWPREVSIAVNVSATQFRSDSTLLQAVMLVLKATGLRPSRLELEITEGVLLNDTTRVLEILHAIKALGVRISMDDFGTGYSSLSYLRKFPFDKIKIDQSFISGADNDPNANAIVRAVAALGASLGIRTTAEGIETHQQLARMRAEGCSEVQGFLTGRPMTAAAAAEILLTPASCERDPASCSQAKDLVA
nr:EAL domain-containing protein [uncultured Lichenicoccus sp.]